jgi:hypothetical protein
VDWKAWLRFLPEEVGKGRNKRNVIEQEERNNVMDAIPETTL